MTSVTLDPVPANRVISGDFVASCDPEDLIYFVLNVGDGDTQLLLLPATAGERLAIVVDVVRGTKLTKLLQALSATPLLPQPSSGPLFALVVATHPHNDHIGGMADFITDFGDHIEEVWEPGFFYTTPTYSSMMNAIGSQPVRHGQPSSGMTRYIGQVKVIVLAPSIGLRNRFDSYGVDVNNSSIALKIEFPGRRVTDRDKKGIYVKARRQSLILGGDAQTLSWSQVMLDFPQLGPDHGPVAEALSKAQGFEPLNVDVFKVPHHASKNGLNLELVTEMSPSLSFVSSRAGGGSYNFPHVVAVEALREALEETVKSGAAHKPDHEIGIHYTCATDTGGKALGTIALVMSPTGGKRDLWRFGDPPSGPIDLTAARRYA
jgi:competence protein ComEC